MVVPVDGLVLESQQLSTNEAAMTGESDAMRKEPMKVCLERRIEVEAEEGFKEANKDPHMIPSPLMMSGTEVVGGTGTMVVVMVGSSSALGMIMEKLNTKQGETPLQRKLETIATDVGKLGTYFALATVHVLMVRFFIDGVMKRQVDLFGGEKTPTGQKLFFVALIEWVEFFTIGVAVVVVAIPEGLPLAVMLSLAYSQRKMLADNNYVKKLQACEIMGGATNICSDKTGTLTLNQMKVTQIWVGGKDVEIPNEQDEVTKKMLPIDPNKYFSKVEWDLIEKSVACNVPKMEDLSATDKGMTDLLERTSSSIEDIRKKHNQDEIRFPFTSKRKRMSTIISNATGNGGYDRRLLIKGASELVMKSCQTYVDGEGNVSPITDAIRNQILAMIESYAEKALRTIALAYRDIQPNEFGSSHSDPINSDIKSVEEDNLVLVGILGIMDVIR